MKLTIDGRPVVAKPEQSLRQIIREMGLVSQTLSDDPLVAKIAGEIFTLNYVPVRHKDTQPDSNTIRRAMAASGGEVHLLRYADPPGRDAYRRTAQFLLFLALRQLYPQATAKMNHTIGSALYISVSGAANFSHKALKQRVSELVAQDIPLQRRRLPTKEAISYFRVQGEKDKAELLAWTEQETLDLYFYGAFADYYYGEMAPSTGYLRVWDILEAEGGFLFLFPDDQDPDRVASYQESPNFFHVFAEGQRWGALMECKTVADLNAKVQSGKIRDLIRVNEALHEKRFGQIADMICQRNAKLVMLAGPSSSGKTTSANRLAVQLRVHGKKPILMSMDDYYMDRDKIPPGPDGKLDLEHINTIDTVLFAEHMRQLLEGKRVQTPTFNFKTGRREWQGHEMWLDESSLLIVEGLHGLNPLVLPQGVDKARIFRIYISPLLPLNLDDHNRIPTSSLRLLRRIVRDYETRGTSVQKTIAMWDSVRRGEKRWIFPFQEQADVIFNSSTLYELAVLKKHIFPLLTAIGPEEECYDDVRAIVKFLNFVLEADVDDELPPTGIIREFIGGNTFYR